MTDAITFALQHQSTERKLTNKLLGKYGLITIN